MEATTRQLIVDLFEINALKFGKFTLKSGIESPVYFDLRVIVSYPEIMQRVSDLLWNAVGADIEFKHLCGVPYTALPLATCMAVKYNKPMLIRRKEAKDYGTKKMIEGCFANGDKCLIVEDVVTSGTSVMETAESLNHVGLKVTDAVVLLNREQGGKSMLAANGVQLHSVLKLSQVSRILEEEGKLSREVVEEVEEFIVKNQFQNGASALKRKPENNAESEKKKLKKCLTYKDRKEACCHAVAKQLLDLMEKKSTNLAFSVDVTKCDEVLKLADLVGPYICILKTHVDVLEDFNEGFIKSLQVLADKHQFLIFEDRKYADIGNTVKLQYGSGLYKTSDWAHIINAHTVPGDGVIKGLKEVGMPKERGCLLIGQMSSKGNLATGTYTDATVLMAEDHSDFVFGFISTSQISSNPKFLHMTPGVKMAVGQDNLEQQYLTPEEVIVNRGSDIIIVGRGIYQAEDPVKAALAYKEAGYNAYLKTIV